MKRNSKKTKKVRNLVLVCTLTAILLTVSTYAWFIGMKTVKVNEFEVKIATTEGLFLSMDGKEWSYNLDAKNATPYDKNANQWLTGKDEGLIPVSTVGDMDVASSRMKIYEKGSLTTTKGGYRLLASKVDNTTNKVKDGVEFLEGDGYVAFDLFIKNLSGDEYYVKNDKDNEEAIYLTYDSSVTVGQGGSAESGIQNSVRVAFAQIGRVIATTTEQSTITGINCTGTPDPKNDTDVTGICREAAIWEPNDTKHVQNAINWYDTSCKKRTAGATEFSYAATENKCGTVVNGTASPTYAIANELKEGSYVDVYDGASFNGYAANTMDYSAYAASDSKESAKLVNYPYFTDTTKELNGANRVEFMSLAPNSITKVRVYIYLEGQDIDNYDFAQLGKTIKINFGFTKERYTDDNGNADGFDYDGPELVTGDDNA